MVFGFKRTSRPKRDPLVLRRGNAVDKKTIVKRTSVVSSTENKSAQSETMWHVLYRSLWVVFVLIVVYVVFFSSFLRMDAIQVTGVDSALEKDVLDVVSEEVSGKYFGLIPKDGYLIVNRKKIESFLRDHFKRFRSVVATKEFPHTLTIHVEEYVPRLIWCSLEMCFYVDENGYAYMSSTHDEIGDEMLKIIDTSGQSVVSDEPFLEREFVNFVADIRDGFRRNLGMEIESECTTPSRFSQDIVCKTHEGWEVYLNARLSSEKMFQALKLLFRKEISDDRRSRLKYVDLRTENRVYYSVEGETVSAPEPEKDADVSQTTVEPSKEEKSSGKEKKKR